MHSVPLPPEPPDDEIDEADAADQPEEELDLLVVLKLTNRTTGTPQEQADLDRLGDELAELVQDAGVGEYDGDELGGGECTMFFCGPDVERLIAVLRPALRRERVARGGSFVRLLEDETGELERRREPI